MNHSHALRIKLVFKFSKNQLLIVESNTKLLVMAAAILPLKWTDRKYESLKPHSWNHVGNFHTVASVSHLTTLEQDRRDGSPNYCKRKQTRKHVFGDCCKNI